MKTQNNQRSTEEDSLYKFGWPVFEEKYKD
jgi:hypothetical protein